MSKVLLMAGALLCAPSCGALVQGQESSRTKVVDDSPKKEVAFSPEAMIGEWDWVEMKKAGELVDKENLTNTVVITKDEIKFKIPFGGFTFLYELKTKEPIAKAELITKESPFGPSKEKQKAVFAFKDEQLVICYLFDATHSGKEVDYPAKLESSEAIPSNMIVLKRKAAAKK
jgi:uncharacterized protein (TIGR03067 family)